MYKIIKCLLVLNAYLISAQTTTKTITYNGLDLSVIITNPERGFYSGQEVHSTDTYEAIDQYLLNDVRSQNITLILREFYLEKFLNSPISAAYLSQMNADFSAIRAGGFKCIVRFAYSDDVTLAQSKWDASKAQVLSHIGQLKDILAANVDVIAFVQAGFVGVYGEWYYTNNFGYPTPDNSARREVINALLAAVPSNRMIQVRTPAIKRALVGINTALTDSQAFTQTSVSRIGQHNDCFLADQTDAGTYENIDVDKSYLEQETKYTPMGGETCQVNKLRCTCAVALAEMKRFHWTYLNIDYNENVLQKFKNGNCFTEIVNRLGYRFRLTTGTYPTTVSNNVPFGIQIKLTNDGFAALYNKRVVYLVLRNSALNLSYSFALQTDARYWTSGAETTIQETIKITNVRAGTYELLLSIPDASVSLAQRPEYSIRFANQQTWEPKTGLNKLNTYLSVV